MQFIIQCRFKISYLNCAHNKRIFEVRAEILLDLCRNITTLEHCGYRSQKHTVWQEGGGSLFLTAG